MRVDEMQRHLLHAHEIVDQQRGNVVQLIADAADREALVASAELGHAGGANLVGEGAAADDHAIEGAGPDELVDRAAPG